MIDNHILKITAASTMGHWVNAVQIVISTVAENIFP